MSGSNKKFKFRAFIFAAFYICSVFLNMLIISAVSTVSAEGGAAAADALNNPVSGIDASSVLADSSGLSTSYGNGVTVRMNTNGLPPPPDITAQAAMLINMGTGNTIYEKNSEQIIYPASTVKIMTAILVVENVPNLNSQTLISQYVADNTTGKKINASVGEVFTVEQLLNAMLLFGANDAALALAEYVSGSVPDFVAKMNEKASVLGCRNTVFTNPSGMHDNSMRTTAADTAKIAAYAAKIQKIMDITSSVSYVIPPTNKNSSEVTLPNRNNFVSQASAYYYPYAKGINAGNTPEAGYSLVTLAEQNGISYLCVVMGSTGTPGAVSETPNSYSDAKSLLDWAFSIYSYKTVVSTKDKISSPEVKLSANRDTVTLVPDADITVLLPQNVDMEKDVETKYTTYKDSLVAPVEVGECLGEITVLYKGQIVGSAKLLSTAAVERSNVLYVLDQIKGIVSRLWFKASVTIFIILFAVYIVIILLRNSKKTPKKFY